MNENKCPKCGAARTVGSLECRKCGVIFSRIKKKPVAIKKQVKKPPVAKKQPIRQQTSYTSSDRINKQLSKLGTIDTWFTKKEVKYLPEVIRHNEVIRGLGSGTLDGNTWLIIATNQRLLFLDKGMVFGLKQTEMHYEQISSISHKTGLLLSSITISTSGGKKEIRNITKQDAPKLTQLISRLIRESKQPVSTQQQQQPTPSTVDNEMISQLERLGKLLSDGILTKEEFNSQKAKLLNG